MNSKLHIVGIGASAGSLEPITEFVSQIQIISVPVSYVIVQHLSPDKKSYMLDLLKDKVQLPIKVIDSGSSVEDNTLYLCPPGQQVVILLGRFVLSELPATHAHEFSIDSFFKSLADEIKSRCIGIILSGSDASGVKGCQEIFEAGGEVYVQEPLEAEFNNMPEAIVQTGFFTRTLRASEMFDELKKHLLEFSGQKLNQKVYEGVLSELDSFGKILFEDFNFILKDYKQATICRRISKRILARNGTDVQDYLKWLAQNPTERSGLLSEVLISVTHFFRDPEFFALIGQVVDEITPTPEEDFRIWSAGCSQGEEAYSILIAVQESFDRRKIKNKFKLFATDLNNENLEMASRAFYTEEDLSLVSQELKAKYFDQKNQGFTIKKIYRDMLVFSRNDLVHSPPFSKMDLVVCRNVLIYLTPGAQNKALMNLVFSLKLNGILTLGPSESLGFLQKNFEVINRKWRIFKKIVPLEKGLSTHWRAPLSRDRAGLTSPTIQIPGMTNPGQSLTEIFSTLFPNSLIINEHLEICAVFGQARNRLKNHTDGVLTSALESLVEESLATVLRAAIAETKGTGRAVRFENIKLNEDTTFPVSVRCVLGTEGSSYYICQFGEEAPSTSAPLVRNAQFSQDMTRALKTELDLVRMELLSTVGELEKINDELQKTNEELISSNEELQSTNEELNSVNEELYTLNNELQQKMEQILSMNDDLNNLINSTNLGVIFLDKTGRIRRLTPVVEQLFFIRPQDIGRSLFELGFGNYLSDVKKSLLSGEKINTHIEIVTKSNESYFCAISPYLNGNGVHEGHVISLMNQHLTDKKKVEKALEEERRISFQKTKLASIGELAAGVGHEINNPLAILMGNLKNLKQSLSLKNPLDATQTLNFEKQEAAALRIQNIVNGLRVLARSDDTGTAVYSAQKLIEDIAHVLKEIYAKEGIQLLTHLSQEKQPIRVNFGHIQQALLNLVSNAKEALENRETKKIEISVHRTPHNEVQIQVIDTGKGIEKNLYPRMYETFFTTKPVGYGTGLGLSISKKLIESNSGRIEFDSAVGVGTTFTITFPLASSEDTLEFSPVLVQEQKIDLQGLRVLLVEDEPHLRELIKLDIENCGCQVVDCDSGSRALEILKKSQFDVVVTDIQMPGMAGSILVKKIKQDLQLDLPSILITGNPLDKSLVALSDTPQLNVKAVLQKPFESRELLQALEKIKSD